MPDRVNRVVDVPLPHACPHCGGEVEPVRVAYRYREDFPQPQPNDSACYEVHIGRCRGCGRRIQPRHPDQT